MKDVGILGHSWEGASLCWREVCQHSNRLGHPAHPDVTMDCISFERCMPAWERGDYEAVRAVPATSVDRLARAGCDFFVCPDNTAHLALEAPGEPLAIPGLHLIDIVADTAQRAGHRRVGILGTRFTMQGPLYPRELVARGIEAVIPTDDDQDLVHATIFDQLVHGVFRDETRTSFVDLIGRLADSGCDAVALVCTEIPLLVSPADSPLPVLDSTRLSGQAALEVALGTRDLPTWRGGQFR
ncbi:amino acid racemase [Rhodococcus pyridinivorans]|uniref:Aspartate racemase n=1 Tax=Rhodococcus pyridinivorans AK37 TaxID=1114960 RepID=H0JR88_9NOCA|nr:MULTISPECIES: amino acid racemase [Rhodococcus]EHK83871.1 aspartate racemase [Rhodococcus pyridinivorans AK37]MCD2140346.1 amino acid racemase [Rhodococcus pyridinivorans]MCW3472676.1 amino acid racemase [Rhodococcus pyridinivorans]QXU55867.1 amino acid racemase [Rhodococcus sp. LW-XY12]UVT25458.1 amino acid racemase [Rhodococcus pyridinivorans]